MCQRRWRSLLACTSGPRRHLSRRALVPGPLPVAFLLQLEQRRPLGPTATEASAGASLPEVEAAADEEQGSRREQRGRDGEASDPGASVLPGLGRRQGTGRRMSRELRLAWAFRRGLVRALLYLHARHVAVAAGAEQRPRASVAGTPGPRRSRRLRSAAAVLVAAAGAPEVVAGADAGGGAQDPLERGTWSPSFQLDAVSAADLLAACEELAAEREAAAFPEEEAEEEASGDDLGAAGQGRQRPAAAGRRLPRPPRQAKRHAPCTDRSQLGSPAFLEHLQQLPSYKDQVRLGFEAPPWLPPAS
jgi:hypothetical protein